MGERASVHVSMHKQKHIDKLASLHLLYFFFSLYMHFALFWLLPCFFAHLFTNSRVHVTYMRARQSIYSQIVLNYTSILNAPPNTQTECMCVVFVVHSVAQSLLCVSIESILVYFNVNTKISHLYGMTYLCAVLRPY